MHIVNKHNHNHCYPIDTAQAMKDLGWSFTTTFEEGIKKTIKWYLVPEGKKWLEECVASNQEWLQKNYSDRK